MRPTPPDRRVITFYSYKGGVGRTMALANVAYRLADTHGLKVIAVDWDLEAPGLHRFFGISSERTTTTNGVLDYFIAWREAVRRKDPKPPAEMREVMSWLIPVTDEKYKPRFGSVSLLLAGRQDKSYDERLAGFHWQEFYTDAEGAVAVERLREKLTETADVVLIDSRTGLTDIGGICTIQVPDGVVLMTAPNEQSLEGTERVARAIAKASIEERADRGRIRVWLAVSRVPSVEETYLAEQWFDDHKGQFDAGIEQDLWSKEEHPGGLHSYEIPHRARWGFGEAPPSDLSRAEAQDPLLLAYERLTGALLRWFRGESAINATSNVKAPEPRRVDISSLETEAAAAELRGDTLGLAIVLARLALHLMAAHRYDEAIRKADQASGIFLSRGAQREQVVALMTLGMSLRKAKRPTEAEDSLQRALKLACELKNRDFERDALHELADLYLSQDAHDKAEEFYKRTIEVDPKNANNLMDYANFLSAVRKDHDKAADLYKHAVRADPNANVLRNYANFLSDIRKDHDTAETFFKRAIEANPTHAYNLGDYAIFLSKIRGNYDKAEEFYKRAIEADTKHVRALGNYAVFLSDIREDPDKAEEFHKRTIAADPQNALALAIYAVFLSDVRGQHEKAEEFYKRAIEMEPQNANALISYAIFLLWGVRKDPDKAEELYKQAVRADPNANVLRNYANFLSDVRKDPDKAEEFYKRALDADPKHVHTLGDYAIFLKNVRENPYRAEEFYKRALDADPQYANSIGNYAGMLLALGRQTDGLSMLDRALDAPNAKLDLRVECWFYALAHRTPERRGEALTQLKRLITGEGARSPGWDFSSNIERARSDGHPDTAWLALLADVISEKADPAVLDAWPAWTAA
jgi:tetratricopeptide (TPR) repeat protein/cellulose biosynthesis protein BcsQ